LLRSRECRSPRLIRRAHLDQPQGEALGALDGQRSVALCSGQRSGSASGGCGRQRSGGEPPLGAADTDRAVWERRRRCRIIAINVRREAHDGDTAGTLGSIAARDGAAAVPLGRWGSTRGCARRPDRRRGRLRPLGHPGRGRCPACARAGLRLTGSVARRHRLTVVAPACDHRLKWSDALEDWDGLATSLRVLAAEDAARRSGLCAVRRVEALVWTRGGGRPDERESGGRRTMLSRCSDADASA